MAAAPTYSPGARVADRFELRERARDFGLGEAWVAADARFDDRLVVVKPLRAIASAKLPGGLVRLLRQVRGVRHPGLLPLLDEGVFAGRPFVVYERFAGASVAAWLDDLPRASPPPLPLLRGVFEGACAAVAALHAARTPLPHGLLCPATLLVKLGGDAPEVRVVDVGLLGELDLPDPTPGRARSTLCLAPEQVAGEPATPASDVCALGMILIELLAARDADPREALYRGRGEVPEALWGAVLEATRAAAAARIGTVAALRERLDPLWDAAPPPRAVSFAGPSLVPSATPPAGPTPVGATLVLPALPSPATAAPPPDADAAWGEWITRAAADVTALYRDDPLARTLGADALAGLTLLDGASREGIVEVAATIRLNSSVQALTRASLRNHQRLVADDPTIAIELAGLGLDEAPPRPTLEAPPPASPSRSAPAPAPAPAPSARPRHTLRVVAAAVALAVALSLLALLRR